MRWGELIGFFGWLVCLTCCPSPIYNLGIRELVPLSDLGTLTCVSLVEHPHSECSTVVGKPFKCSFGTQTFQIQCFKFVGEGYPTCIFWFSNRDLFKQNKIYWGRIYLYHDLPYLHGWFSKCWSWLGSSFVEAISWAILFLILGAYQSAL